MNLDMVWHLSTACPSSTWCRYPRCGRRRGAQRAAAEYNLEIGAGLGALAGKTWRIGLMGFASNERNVLYCLSALEAILARRGAAIPAGGAIPAARAVFGS